MDLLEHIDRFTHVGHRDFLGRRHQHSALNRHQLRQAQLRIARSRRHIDDQVIKLSPIDVIKKLAYRGMEHRATPDHRAIPRVEETERHDFYPVRQVWHQHLSVNLRLVVNAYHNRYVRAINIRIEQADFGADLG